MICVIKFIEWYTLSSSQNWGVVCANVKKEGANSNSCKYVEYYP
jgi:hypothetical protein